MIANRISNRYSKESTMSKTETHEATREELQAQVDLLAKQLADLQAKGSPGTSVPLDPFAKDGASVIVAYQKDGHVLLAGQSIGTIRTAEPYYWMADSNPTVRCCTKSDAVRLLLARADAEAADAEAAA